jgi:hypothetical protein
MKKNWDGMGASPTNARSGGSGKSGSRRSIFAPATASAWPKRSQTSTNPVTAENIIMPASRTPVTQASARGPHVLPCTMRRSTWKATATTAASEA